ncbi:MAG: nuclear transport factor 2 family protein [Chloracidobacterium sp.]|nr:nuclear transport factor 2 family protein [Chloracidobacterium sp.]
MKKIISISIVILVSAFAAVAQCSDADKKALEALDHAWSEAGQKGDRAALMAFYADDYVGLPGMVSKTVAIDNAMRAFERNKANPAGADRTTYDNYIISCTPNTATVTHRNTVWTPMGEGGKPETYYSRSVHVLEKRSGKWQVVSNAGNDLDEYAIIWYLEQDWNTAFWKKDGEWFKKNFAADFSNIGSDTGAVTGKDAAIGEIVNDKSTYDLVETQDMDISLEGRTARVTGIFHLRGKGSDGKAFDTKIRYTDIWVKRDGHWVAWSSQGTIMK